MKYLNLFILMAFTMILFCGCAKHDSVKPALESTEIVTVTYSVKDTAKTETTATITTSSNTKTTTTAIIIAQTSTSMSNTTETIVTTLTEFQTSYNTTNGNNMTVITTNVVEQPVNTGTTESTKDLIENGLFYCRYTVKQNNEWYSIYTDYWVTKDQICAFNGINPNENLQAGWIIYIPLDTYVPPNVWAYDYQPIYDVNYRPNNGNSIGEGTTPNGVNDDGLVWESSVTLETKNSEWGSWYNIKLSASMLDGFKLGPGESFSWFLNMGPCQYDQGFVDGGAFVEGGSAPGGGICFTSTGLMQGAREAGCVITEKYDHTESVSYAVPGDEASVSWGYQDLKFYNPSQTTGLQFWVTADEYAKSITVDVCPYYTN